MADISEAVNCIQDLIDVANCHGSACVYKRNGGVGRLENVLECLNEKQKSADEMFHELGHEDRTPEYMDRKYARVYSNGKTNIVCDKNGASKEGERADTFSTLEIFATAQLIREMEAQK